MLCCSHEGNKLYSPSGFSELACPKPSSVEIQTNSLAEIRKGIGDYKSINGQEPLGPSGQEAELHLWAAVTSQCVAMKLMLGVLKNQRAAFYTTEARKPECPTILSTPRYQHFGWSPGALVG